MRFSESAKQSRKNPDKYRVYGDTVVTDPTMFRVLHLRPLGQLSVYVIPHFFRKLLERTDGKNNKIFNFRTGEKPEIMGFLSGENSQLFKKFRVQTLRPLGYISVVDLCIISANRQKVNTFY